ncbi:HlyD family efflux transporter periplasmic adaptor subunit, partial [Salmonella enterica subsp. enterica serovar Enteritidis]|nr:HlyD family efflux transporter periplasmic adaptor subunit [Salmonella enterica subsp. enterica serovar Enteritidis]
EQLAKARREEIATGLSVTGEQLAALRPKLRAARERMERTEILAPIDGYVLNLAIHGPGATLSAGQVAMEIVPDTDDLVLNVKIAPRDIEQLSEGQSAEVHFTINKARYQNAIGGELIRLSPDRKIDEVTRAAYYEAVVAINHDDLARAGVKLIPGMAATAAIVTGKRTVLEYFIDPILEVASLAMRES